MCSFCLGGWDCNNSWVRFQFSSLFGLVHCWCFFLKGSGRVRVEVDTERGIKIRCSQ